MQQVSLKLESNKKALRKVYPHVYLIGNYFSELLLISIEKMC